MASPFLSWVAVGVVAFVGNAALRPAIAAGANEEEPTVTPYGMPARTAPPPADNNPPPANAPRTPRTATPPPANAAPPAQPNPAPPPGYGAYPPPGYPPPGYPPPGYPPGYAPPGYAPPGYAPYPGYPPGVLTKVHRPRRGLVTGGAITFGVSWGIAASVSFLLDCNGCSNSADYLWVPIAGPLIVAGRDSSDAPGIFILWSAAEAAGIVMFIVGMVGHDVMEYRVAERGPTLHLTPLFARDTSGLALTARW